MIQYFSTFAAASTQSDQESHRSAIALCPSSILQRARRLSRCVFFALVSVSAVSVVGPPATAGEIVVGVGQDNVNKDGYSEALAAQFEYRTDPFRTYSWGDIAFVGILEVDDDNDAYAGVGVSAKWNVSERWFFEGSLAAGYYEAGSDSLDLGSDHQFRTLVGLGLRVSEKSSVSMAVDHLSNANTADTNPGRDAIYLRYGRSF